MLKSFADHMFLNVSSSCTLFTANETDMLTQKSSRHIIPDLGIQLNCCIYVNDYSERLPGTGLNCRWLVMISKNTDLPTFIDLLYSFLLRVSFSREHRLLLLLFLQRSKVSCECRETSREIHMDVRGLYA